MSMRMQPPYVIGPRTYRDFMDTYARDIFTLPGVRFVSKAPTALEQTTLVYDDATASASAGPWQRRIRLSYDIASRPGRETPWLMAPYSMHPSIYTSGEASRLAMLRQRPRRMAVLFAGNVDPRVYAAPGIARLCERLSQMNRREMFERLMSSPLPWTYLRNEESMQRAITEEAGGMFVATSDVCPIPNSQWLTMLASSAFYVAGCGALMPMCHNAIEAMAVGAIPILMYPDWFHPRLEHGVNCLHVRNADDLIPLIERALHMPAPSAAQMRRNVVAYYEEHLSPQSFRAKLDAVEGRDVDVFVNLELPQEMERLESGSVALAG